MPRAHRPSTSALLLSAVLAGCGGGGHGSRPAEDAPFAIAVGDVDSVSAILWAKAETAGTVRFRVATDPAILMIVAAPDVVVSDPAIPVKAEITGLLPRTTYHYRAEVPGVDDPAPGTFRTAAAVGVQAGLHFGVGGDWRGEMAPYPSIANAATLDLDFFVALGDTIYADVASPAVPVSQAMTLAEFRAKHREVYSAHSGRNILGELRASTALFATIDDHEVIDDFSGGADPAGDPRFPSSGESYINDTALFETGLQAFLEHNPIRDETYVGTGDPVVEGEKKLYRFRTFGSDAAVMMLDTRSFRSEMLDNPNPLDSGSVAQFRSDSFQPGRTLLGIPQLQDLEADLSSAQAAGVKWKFVMVPEPIQNLGPGNARDRFEGYAYERSRLLGFIQDNGITNVVFICADIHGTVVNNLEYQPTSPSDAQVAVDAFEISTPAVAYDPALGRATIDAITLTPVERAAYDSMSMDAKDDFFTGLLDASLANENYDETGLDGSTIGATLVQGKWVRAHAYGWCEFQIDPVNSALTVTTWGIEPYTPSESSAAAGRTPFILNQFVVVPR